MAETTLMTIIESVANEMFEKYLLSRLEKLVDDKLAAFTQTAQTKDATARARIDMAFKEIDRLMQVMGVDSVESEAPFAYPPKPVLSALDSLTIDSNIHTSLLGEMREVVHSIVVGMLEEMNWAKIIADHIDPADIVQDGLDMDWDDIVGPIVKDVFEADILPSLRITY